ncbi:MAG: hypothetical protein ABGW77_07155 [Campylobacterales bacterium]
MEKWKWKISIFVVGIALFLGGCGPRQEELIPSPPSPPKVARIEDFSLNTFLKLKKVIGKYSYLLLRWEYPEDKLCLGEIKNKSKVIPPYFDYYIDLKELMGNYLILIQPPTHQCEEIISGNVVVETLGSQGHRWEGDIDSNQFEASGIGSRETLNDKYRIMMSLTLTSYPSLEIDSAAQNVITYREREKSIDLAISFLNFSIGYSHDLTKKDSIIRTLKALADFSLIQIISKNYAIPFWYLYPNQTLTPNRALLIAQQGIFEKYYIKYTHRAGLALGKVLRRGLVKLFGVSPAKLKKEVEWKLNPSFNLATSPVAVDRNWAKKIVKTAKAQQGYCPLPSPVEERLYRATKICLPEENPNFFSRSLQLNRYEEKILKRVVAGILRDNLVANREGFPLFSGDGLRYRIGKQEHLYILLEKPLAQRLLELSQRPFSQLSQSEKEELIALIITATNPLIPPSLYHRYWGLSNQ